MILKKPYMFFIKFFKPAHFVLSVLLAYMIYLTNKILIFLNNYIYSTENVVGENIKESFFSDYLIIMPIILIIFSLIFLGIMFYKNKPMLFYVTGVFAFLIVLIINLYTSNFLIQMEKSILSIKIVKLNHDLVLINMIIEVIYFIFLFIRGLGLNLKKFNFDSDVARFDVSEADKEEFELNINVDFDYVKANRKRNLRYFKYFYKENKISIYIFSVLLFITAIIIFLSLKFNSNDYVEGIVYSAKKFDFKVNESVILNEDYRGNKITDNYLIIVNTALKTNLKNISLFSKDFSLEIGDAVFESQKKYSYNLIDVGQAYDNTILNNKFTDYIFIFEVPEKYIKSDFFLVYNDEGYEIKIKLDPRNYTTKKIENFNNINELIDFNETLGDISFTITSFFIEKKFMIKYDFCIKDDDCIKSVEYIKPSINEDFDKCVLKLKVDYLNNSNLQIKNFYEFLTKFGSIYYKLGDTWFEQKSNFELISSKWDNHNIYIGVNNKILNATSIKLVFNIRDSKYEYLLK